MKRLLLLSALFAAAAATQADTWQTVTVDGDVVENFATGISFDGDNVTLLFEDGTSLTADMSAVSIDLTYDQGETPSGITETAAMENPRCAVYSLGGQYLGGSTDGLPKGIYIVNGKKLVIK